MTITRIVRSTLIVVALAFATVAIAGTKKDETEPSKYKSKTPPDALSGNHGDSWSPHFFSWVSDVERPKTLFDYVYLFKNEHANRTLTAEWLAADMEKTRFNGYGKYRNFFQSSQTYEENDKAIIRYGPGLQYKVQAPTYVKQAKKKAGKPKLKSRVSVSRVAPLRDNDVVDLQFESFTADNRIHVSVLNSGNIKTQPFVMPQLHSLLQGLNEKKIITYKRRWPISERFKFERSVVFEASRDSVKQPPKKIELVVEVGDNATIEEHLIRLIVLDPYEGTRVTSARVSVYVPKVKK